MGQPPGIISSVTPNDEAIKRFFLSVPVDSHGAVVELNGRPLACLVPPPRTMNGTEEKWTEVKNERRCELIDRKYDGPPLTPTESAELIQLQEEMLRYRQRVAPLPIEDARRLHQELLAQASAPESEK